ncbi:LacI family DNA-binding transcriptional regulator [Falsirhodobacter halotolerans]|uniref:LacI family DNA-binding transcriptional regulator n=1 Tax=Falsirhodobacter halotolerans TaxID=1146892 RepID=UPI001FD2C443|nr:LacI family DNA-binding transcriptional regulator [Falsirhodobacter halotolerans]MCJ8141291.1 LacI family transcriptional regulator [Falsirhodobacter halotolerans]
MTKNHTPRVRDVAELANVSTATVSRTLSRPDLVSEATRDLVLRAVEQTGYTINMAARNLRRQRTGCILALVPNLANPFFAAILAGINSELRGRGLSLLVADTTADPDAPDMLVEFAHRSRTDGLIVLDGSIPASVLTRAACPPVVLACEWIEGLTIPRVIADNQAGSAMAARHLVDLGHRRILHLTGPSGNPLTVARHAAAMAALADAGVAPDPALRIEGDFTLASGQAAATAILAMPTRPTAVLCHNDEMACGLMGALQEGGLRVPDDISIIGFDDIAMSAHVSPALTSIRQQRDNLGAVAARTLLALLDGDEVAPETVLPVDLVLRGSTARP